LIGDNTAGTGPLTINIQPINYNVICPAGVSMAAQFPAPNGQTHYVTGLGQASIYWVDFPVLPGAGAVNILNSPTVTVGNVPLPVLVPINVSGAPYQVAVEPAAAESHYDGAITGAVLVSTITPTAANLYLRKLRLKISANATSAAATITVTCVLNGVTVYTETVVLATLPALLAELDFDTVGLNAAAGGLVTTISAALTAGLLEINTWWTP
jgi:hypothetical protein